MQQVTCNMLLRRLIGLSAAAPVWDVTVWDVTVFTKHRERLSEGGVGGLAPGGGHG